MGQASKIVVILALLLLPSIAALGSDHEIAVYGRAKGERPGTYAKIWLMEQDGSNPIWVYESCGWAAPSWSPDGESLVVWQSGRNLPGFEGVYRLDLSDPPSQPSGACGDPAYEMPPQIVPSEGLLQAPEGSPFEALDGLLYDSTGVGSGPIIGANWSPTRNEIALIVSGCFLELQEGEYCPYSETFYALAAKDPSDASAPLVPIYYQPGVGIGSFSWSPDGSQLLVALDTEPFEPKMLMLVNRDTGEPVAGPWIADEVLPQGIDYWAKTFEGPAMAPVNPDPLRYVGPVVAFDLGVRLSKNKFEHRMFLLDLGQPGAWAEEIGVGRSAAWSPDAQFLAVRINDDSPQRIEIATGTVTELGDFWWAWNPDWKPALSTECGDGSCEGSESQCNCETDCGAPPAFEDSCADDIDNNCDGRTDCDDPFCEETYPSCLCDDQETVCDDGIDNDCDTDLDCFDSDCFSDPICEPEPVDCSGYVNKRSCNGDQACRWNNRNKVCVSR